MKRVIGVIGAGITDDELCERAREVGRLLAEHDCTLVTGGLSGVMEAASQGAAERTPFLASYAPRRHERERTCNHG